MSTKSQRERAYEYVRILRSCPASEVRRNAAGLAQVLTEHPKDGSISSVEAMRFDTLVGCHANIASVDEALRELEAGQGRVTDEDDERGGPQRVGSLFGDIEPKPFDVTEAVRRNLEQAARAATERPLPGAFDAGATVGTVGTPSTPTGDAKGTPEPDAPAEPTERLVMGRDGLALEIDGGRRVSIGRLLIEHLEQHCEAARKRMRTSVAVEVVGDYERARQLVTLMHIARARGVV